MNKNKIRKILMPRCHRTMNEERKKRSQRRYWNFGIFLLLAACFFTPYSSVLDTYQLEFHKILEISQDRKDQITVYFDSFAL